MRNLKILTIMLVIISTSLFSQTTWSVDKAHTKVGFSVTYLVITDVEGYFKEYDAQISTSDDDFTKANIDFTVNANSIFTDNDKRDTHLRSDDFFNAEKYPQMVFKGKSIKKIDDKNFKLTGDFTIRDVTKQVALNVKYNGTVKDPWGNTKAGFKITGEIDRFDYNLKWNKSIETGSLVVGKEVELVINLQLVKKQ